MTFEREYEWYQKEKVDLEGGKSDQKKELEVDVKDVDEELMKLQREEQMQKCNGGSGV